MKQQSITFSCPNGHQYTVPASFAGKKTFCKVCKAEFVIPRHVRPLETPPSDPVAEEEAPEALPVSADDPVPEPTGDAQAHPQTFQAFPALAIPPASTEPFPAASAFPTASFPPPFGTVSAEASSPARADGVAYDQIANGTARLVARLWAERGHGGEVELQLANGNPLKPDFYDPYLSDGTHGLFANHMPDGTVIITAVRWDAVQKVTVRNVEGLPDGMFEAFDT